MTAIQRMLETSYLEMRVKGVREVIGMVQDGPVLWVNEPALAGFDERTRSKALAIIEEAKQVVLGYAR